MRGNKGIGRLRRRIDTLNRAVLRLLNRRVRAAQAIGAIKRRRGMNISDPARERAILRCLTRENPGPLDARAVRNIFQAIMRQTRRLERKSN